MGGLPPQGLSEARRGSADSLEKLQKYFRKINEQFSDLKPIGDFHTQIGTMGQCGFSGEVTKIFQEKPVIVFQIKNDQRFLFFNLIAISGSQSRS
jgi:hypothetical protein